MRLYCVFTLNHKYQEVKLKNGDVVMKGPYYVLTKKGAGNKTVSKSIPAAEAPHVQGEVDNYKRFRELSDEYVEVCEEISIIKHGGECEDEVKKTRHSGRV